MNQQPASEYPVTRMYSYRLGVLSNMSRTEVSLEEYLVYTNGETEKVKLQQ